MMPTGIPRGGSHRRVSLLLSRRAFQDIVQVDSYAKAKDVKAVLGLTF